MAPKLKQLIKQACCDVTLYTYMYMAQNLNKLAMNFLLFANFAIKFYNITTPSFNLNVKPTTDCRFFTASTSHVQSFTNMDSRQQPLSPHGDSDVFTYSVCITLRKAKMCHNKVNSLRTT